MGKSKSKRKTANFFENMNSLKFNLIFLLFALVLAFILYGRTLGYELSYFDDDAIILANTQTLSEGISLKKAFLSDAEFSNRIELYRPLQNLSFMINYSLYGDDFGLYRIDNILLHALNSLLFLMIIAFFFKNRIFQISGALFFLLHPMFVLNVAWLPARGDVLLATTGFMSVLFFLEFIKSKKIYLIWLHLLLLFLALLSKESAVVIPVICMVIYFFQSEKTSYLKKFAFYILSLIPVVALFLYLRSLSIHDLTGGSFGLKPFLFNLQMIPEFFYKLLIPYSIPYMPFYELTRSIAGLVLMALFVALAVFVKTPFKALVPGLAWFILLSVPAMLYRPEWSNFAYDYCLHRSYFPAAGIILLILSVFHQIKSSKALVFLAGIYILLSGVSSFIATADFKNSLVFYEACARTNPKSALIQNNLGNACFMKNNFNRAVSQYNLAIGLKPDFADAHYNLGVVKMKSKKPQEALSAINKAIELRPENINYLLTKARILTDIKDYANAALIYEDIQKKQSLDADSEFAYAYCLFNTGNYQRSAEVLTSLLKNNPQHNDALLLRARIYHLSGNTEKAVADIKQTGSYQDNPGLLSNLGYLYFDMDSIDESERHFLKSIERKPENADAYLGLAICSFVRGNKTMQEQYLLKASEAEPMLKERMEGINKMVRQGYYFTPKEMAILEKMLK